MREIEALPASEVEGWRAFYNVQPFGPWRDNYHSAMVAHILAQAYGDPKRSGPVMSDFFFKDAATQQREKDEKILNFFGIPLDG